jgi:ribosomal protein L7Ae-like RNA K-turn-binding protein
MTDEIKRAYGYLGLAARAGKLASGEFSVETAVKKRKAYAVIVAGDASDNTKKQFRNMCAFYQVPYFELADRLTLGRAVGKGMRASCAITDESLAKAAIRSLQILKQGEMIYGKNQGS